MSWQVVSDERGLVVTTDQGSSAHLSWRWLRDHGEDPASYNLETQQRRIDALGTAPAPASNASVANERLNLTWDDSPDATWISTATLRSVLGEATAPGVTTAWASAAAVGGLTTHAVADVLADDYALSDWMRDLGTWGFARLRGFDGTHHQSREIANRIGYVRETIFGGLWDLASDVTDHDDTAYTQTFLAPHTDGTYSHEAPGLQMFCCVERSGTGGESVVVDGLAIAEELRNDHPDAFAILTTVNVPAHYVEPGVDLRAERPSIRLDDDGNFVQLSLNNYDRSPMLLPGDEMDRFYEAYGLLQRMAEDQDRWFAVRLEAGDVLINDNWRVMHGRLAYTGDRRFVGCYLNHEDFESRCRTLGITL